MYWSDVAMILFSCVAANHLGLIQAVEKVLDRELPIVNCSRCFSFWCVFFYMAVATNEIIVPVATSFLCAAFAPWLELLMGLTDFYFNKLYDTIYSTTENEECGEAELEEDS